MFNKMLSELHDGKSTIEVIGEGQFLLKINDVIRVSDNPMQHPEREGTVFLTKEEFKAFMREADSIGDIEHFDLTLYDVEDQK